MKHLTIDGKNYLALNSKEVDYLATILYDGYTDNVEMDRGIVVNIKDKWESNYAKKLIKLGEEIINESIEMS